MTYIKTFILLIFFVLFVCLYGYYILNPIFVWKRQEDAAKSIHIRDTVFVFINDTSSQHETDPVFSSSILSKVKISYVKKYTDTANKKR